MPELVLQADDPVGVAGAVAGAAGQGEQGEAACAGGRAFRPGEHQRDVGVGVRAEPFLAVQPPDAVLVAGDGLDRADIGPAGLLGHELRAFPQRGKVGRQHLGQQVILQRVAAELADQVDRGVGDADRAHQAELALHEQVLEGVFGDRRQRAVHAQHAAAMGHGVELEVAERDLLHLAIGGVVFDPVLVAAEAVARMQDGRVAVGDARQFVQPAAGELAEALVVRRQPVEHVRRQIDRQQVAQSRIGGEEIHAGTVGGDPVRAGAGGVERHCSLLGHGFSSVVDAHQRLDRLIPVTHLRVSHPG